MTLNDAEAIADPFNVPDVVGIAPEVLSTTGVSYKKTTLRVSVSGVTPAYAVVRNRPVAIGNFITETDVNGRTRVAVIGSRIAERFFAEANVYPVGATIKINNVPFKVIGVLEARGRHRRTRRQPG